MDRHYSYFDSELSFHYTLTEKPDGFTMHTHEFYELYLFIRGCADFRIEGTRYPLHPGDVLVMSRAESHAIEITGAEPYERMALHFDPSLIMRLDPSSELLRAFLSRDLGKGNLFSPSDFSSPLCKMLLSGLLNKPENNPRLHIISFLIPLLNELRLASTQRKNGDSLGGVSQDKRIIDYINSHLSDDLSLDNICAAFYISKPQLCRIFKASTGSTVWQYITIKRLMAAAQLIKEGTPPTRASIMCGFNDYSVFYRAYMRHFGVSPKAS